MDEREWLASTDPSAMLLHLCGEEGSPGWEVRMMTGARPSDRKLRLYACAVALHAWGGARGQVLRNVEAAYAAVERGHGHGLFDESPLALVASELTPACLNRPGDAALFAALLREVVGDPFRPTAARQKLKCPQGHDALAPLKKNSYPVPLSACLVCHWQGPPWPDVVRGAAPSWITPAVRGIAARAYGLRDWEALPILADALQEAGCEDEDVLMHCRGQGRCPECLGKGGCCSLKDEPGVWGEMHGCALCAGSGRVDAGPHVRGCWVLDLLLGKG